MSPTVNNMDAVALFVRYRCARNEQSLFVSYKHLADGSEDLAIWLADYPKDLMELFDEVALQG